jgi:molecular chaperone DnaK (HSP70)
MKNNIILIIFVWFLVPFCFGSEPDRLSYPIGIATLNGFTELIPSGTQLPHTFSDVFANAEDGQQGVTINISQKIGNEVKAVADLDVSGFPPKPKGMLKLELTIVVSEKKKLFVYLEGVRHHYSKNWGPFNVD